MARDVDLFAPLELAPWLGRSTGSTFDVEFVAGEDAVIRLRGELDLAAVGTFEAAAWRLLDEGGGRVVLDLHELEFLDVSGINAVLALARAARRTGGDLVLRGPRPDAVDLLERTRALDMLVVEA